MKLLLLFLIAAPAPAQYANPKTCAGCHPAIAKTYRQNGMGRSFSPPKPEILIEDFTKNNSYYHPASDTWFQMLNRGGVLTQRRYQLGFDKKETNVEEKRIDYIVGSGNHMRTYVHRNADGTLQELPLAWYAEKGGYWAMNPGYDTADYPYSRRQIAYDCMFCHNAYPQVPARHDRLGDTPVYEGAIPEGIDCQRCHGPGQRHVDIAMKPGSASAAIRSAIVNPSRLINDRQVEVCAQCHLKTTEFRLPHAIKRYERADFSYKPGEPLSAFVLAFDQVPKNSRFETASAVTRMRESQCFLKSKAALTCTTCHNPHDVRHGSEAIAQYDAACTKCHATLPAEHTEGGECVTCHMPKRRTEDIVHLVMTDHLIQRKPPAGDLLADLPEHHESASTSYRGEVAPAYPSPLPPTIENLYYLALAQIQDQANLVKGLPDFQKALAAWNPTRPEPYMELADALRAAGQAKAAFAAYQSAIAHDPSYLPAQLEFASALKGTGQAAVTVAKRATVTAAADSRAWNALGQAQLDTGDLAGARESLAKALTLDPEMPEAHNGLGIVLAQTGDPSAGEARFREAIRILPNYAEAHGNLANLLAWRQSFQEATYEFEKAVHLGPTDIASRLNYGVMLSSLRDFNGAQQQIEAALKLNPALAEAHDLRGALLERKGQIAEALAEYKEAVRLQPALFHAQLNLGAVLLNNGDAAGAAEHLREAAKSPDPAIRDQAERLLKR